MQQADAALATIVSLLEASLGRETAQAEVAAAVQAIESHDPSEVLAHLSQSAGLVGVSARLARARLPRRLSVLPPLLPPDRPQRVPASDETASHLQVRRRGFANCEAPFPEPGRRSMELVDFAVTGLGLDGARLDRGGALAVLDTIARTRPSGVAA